MPDETDPKTSGAGKDRPQDEPSLFDGLKLDHPTRRPDQAPAVRAADAIAKVDPAPVDTSAEAGCEDVANDVPTGDDRSTPSPKAARTRATRKTATTAPAAAPSPDPKADAGPAPRATTERIGFPLGIPLPDLPRAERLADALGVTSDYLSAALVRRALDAMAVVRPLDPATARTVHGLALKQPARRVPVPSALLDALRHANDPLDAYPKRHHAQAAFQALLREELDKLAAEHGVDEADRPGQAIPGPQKDEEPPSEPLE